MPLLRLESHRFGWVSKMSMTDDAHDEVADAKELPCMGGKKSFPVSRSGPKHSELEPHTGI